MPQRIVALALHKPGGEVGWITCRDGRQAVESFLKMTGQGQVGAVQVAVERGSLRRLRLDIAALGRRALVARGPEQVGPLPRVQPRWPAAEEALADPVPAQGTLEIDRARDAAIGGQEKLGADGQ